MYKSVIGQRFGRLTVQKETPTKVNGGTKVICECRCDCGKVIEVRKGNLQSGNTTSCGCARKGHPHIKDFSGMRFGRLLVLRPTGEKLHTNHIWLCQCDCGNLVEVCNINLTNGGTRSCGCLNEELRPLRGRKAAEKLRQSEWVDNTSLCGLTQKLSKANKSGCKGVCFSSRDKCYIAYITLRGKQKRLGSFSKYDDAVKARKQAEEELYEPILNAHGRTFRKETSQ